MVSQMNLPCFVHETKLGVQLQMNEFDFIPLYLILDGSNVVCPYRLVKLFVLSFNHVFHISSSFGSSSPCFFLLMWQQETWTF